LGLAYTTGEFLCFPSDDSYYVPSFGEKMLRAATLNGWDLVYCNTLYDLAKIGEGQGYGVLNVEPRRYKIDKTCFIVRRRWFEGFPGKTEGSCEADANLIEQLVVKGISHGKVNEVLVVHN
jgi:hypothetical protein